MVESSTSGVPDTHTFLPSEELPHVSPEQVEVERIRLRGGISSEGRVNDQRQIRWHGSNLSPCGGTFSMPCGGSGGGD